mgnify:CR=1 FL=1
MGDGRAYERDTNTHCPLAARRTRLFFYASFILAREEDVFFHSCELPGKARAASSPPPPASSPILAMNTVLHSRGHARGRREPPSSGIALADAPSAPPN